MVGSKAAPPRRNAISRIVNEHSELRVQWIELFQELFEQLITVLQKKRHEIIAPFLKTATDSRQFARPARS